MSVVRLNNGKYALRDNLVGIVACGTRKQMEALLKSILICGTELRAQVEYC